MRVGLLALLLVFALASCSDSSKPAQGAPSVPMADSAAIAEATSHGPWLRERLPADTIAYVRVPSLWGALAAPGGKAGDAMSSSQAMIDSITSVRRALLSDERVLELGEGAVRLIDALASPIELAVVAPGKAASPAAGGLLSVRLKAADAAEVAGLLTQASDGAFGGLGFDAEGNASVDMGGNPVYLHYMAAEQRLFVLGGMFASAQQLQTLVEDATKAKDDHPMRGLERRIDAGGQGVLIWLDASAARPLLLTGLRPDQEWLRPALQSAKALALGWGAANQSGNLALRMEFDKAPWGDMFRAGPHSFDATSAGDPDWVVTLVVPGIEQIESAFNWIQSAQGEGVAPTSFAEVEAQVTKATGLTLADWLKPWAGPTVMAGDASGQWHALKLADAAALTRIVEIVGAREGGKHSTHVHAGTTLHHLQLPSTTDMMKSIGATDAQAAMPTNMPWLELYGRVKSHVYFYEDAGWIYTASVPQPLLERIDRSADTKVGEWLQRTQHSGRELAPVSASSQLQGVSNSIYAVNLEVLKILADVSGAKVDLFALPTAQQLALPKDSPIGIELVVDANQLALQVNYGHTPIEGLGSGGGMASVAVVGILAAFAMPAYHDYTLRAQVSTALGAAAPLTMAVSQHFEHTGRLPGADDIDLDLPLYNAGVQASIELDAGAVRVRFDEDAPAGLAGQHVYLRPTLDSERRLGWACANAAVGAGLKQMVKLPEHIEASSLEARLLPNHCR